MSGTLFNKATFPYIFDQADLSDTIPKVIERIKSSSPEKTLTINISGTPEEFLENLYNSSSLGPGGIIETTGYIPKEQTEAYARVMLKLIHEKYPEITAIPYYEGNILKVIQLNRETPVLFENGQLPPEALAALWEVAHGQGSNILVNPTGHSFPIVGKHIKEYGFAQNAMRKRGLGAGQRLEIAVPDTDRSIMADKLKKYLNIQIGENEPLSVDQVIQYALLNEILEETGNNWRAVEMRMKIALLEPLMNLIWNESTTAETALKLFAVIKPLIIRQRHDQPSELYGASIFKLENEKAMEQLLKNWKAHPVLQAIKDQPNLFKGINPIDIEKKFENIAATDPGPLQPLVDSTYYVGQKQRTKTLEKVKLHVKQRYKTREKARERIMMHVKKREVHTPGLRNPRQLRREPYHPLPIVHKAADLFTTAAHNPLPLEEVKHLQIGQLQPDVLAARKAGAFISVSEMLKMDNDLNNALQINEPDLSISLNLAPVWEDSKGVSPLYTPYNPFQKFASHALLIHDEAAGTLKLFLVDPNDSETILDQLKADRNSAASKDLHLSLYHLVENRIIASGKTAINPQANIL